MPQYVEGPEAKGMESGFALDELLRRERGANSRAAFQAMVGRDQALMEQTARMKAQQAQQQFAQQQAEQQQGFALERMVKGEQLKEQGAQADADRSAPAIQAMMAGNPQAAKAFGYTQSGPEVIQRQGAMAEPEAAGIPAPVQAGPPVGRTPTTAEAAGLSRAVPGIAQALMQNAMKGSGGEGFTLSPGQVRFDPMGNEIARGGPQDIGMSLEQAKAIKEQLEQDPANKGRVLMQSHEKGGWTVSLSAQQPLTPPDPFNTGYWDRVNNGMDPKAALAWYKTQKAEAAGERQLNISLNTPLTEPQLQSDQGRRITLDAFNSLKSMTDIAPEMVKEFLTWKGSATELYNKFSRLPGMQYMVGPEGLNQQEFIQRYNDWSANMGQLRKGSFDIGGKQLTPFEDSVVRMTIPTVQDSPEAYKAKIAWLGSYVGAQQYYVSWARLNPRLSQDANQQQAAWEAAKKQAGIDTSKATDWHRNMDPNARLRQKVLEK